MIHIATEMGQRRDSAATHIAETTTNESSPAAQPLITLDDIHAVIVHDAFHKVQLHYHAALAYPEAKYDPEFLASLAEANDYYLEMFEPLSASAARASVAVGLVQ